MKMWKRLSLWGCAVILSLALAGCGGGASDAPSGKPDVYKLFPTQNYWTFLKLNTSTGEVWQVHFAIDDDNARGTVPLNAIPLTEQGMPGRFTLYPTNNMYNFILLDQQDGRSWQIQWAFEEENRGVIASLDK